MNDSNIILFIDVLRRDLKFTYKELSERAHMKRSTLYDLLDEGRITTKSLKKILDCFGISFSAFFLAIEFYEDNTQKDMTELQKSYLVRGSLQAAQEFLRIKSGITKTNLLKF